MPPSDALFLWKIGQGPGNPGRDDSGNALWDIRRVDIDQMSAKVILLQSVNALL